MTSKNEKVVGSLHHEREARTRPAWTHTYPGIFGEGGVAPEFHTSQVVEIPSQPHGNFELLSASFIPIRDDTSVIERLVMSHGAGKRSARAFQEGGTVLDRARTPIG